MFSWQSSFFLQFIIDNYEKEVDDEEREKFIKALVSYHSPELMMKFISAKGNPQMLSPNVSYNLYSIIIDYIMDVDYQISSYMLIQIIDYLMKVLTIRQAPKLFQKIEPFFFVVFGNTFHKYSDQEIEKLYQSLKGISLLPLSFFSFSPLSHSINQNHKMQKIFKKQKHILSNQTNGSVNNNNDSNNKNFIATETFSVLVNSADSYLNSPRLANIWIESLSAIFRSEAKIDFDLLIIYSLCDKISMTTSSNQTNSSSNSNAQNFTWDYEYMPLYFKAHFFDSLSYFLSPMNSLQIAKTHFFRLAGQINNSCTVEDLSSLIQYSKHLIELRIANETSSFTVDMICEIIFSSILPHFRKSKKLEDTFNEFCDMLDNRKLEDFVNTHFTTCSISAQQYLISHFPNNEQDIEVLFKEPIDSELIHLYVSSSYNIHLSNSNILKYLVHFFEYTKLEDFRYLIPMYKINPYLFCAKVIQYMSICDNFEKMNFLLSFLMSDDNSDNGDHQNECPIVIYSSSVDKDINQNNSTSNDSTSIISLDSAFLSVLYEAIQFPSNQKIKFFYCFLDYLRQCRQYSTNNSYSPNTIAKALNQKIDSSSSSSQDLQTNESISRKDEKSPQTPKNLSSSTPKSKNNDNLERTPIRTPKMTRRLSIDEQSTPQESQQQSKTKDFHDGKHLTLSIPKRRLSDADSPCLSQNSPYGPHSPFSPLNSSIQKEINQTKTSLVRQSSRDAFSTPRGNKTFKRKFKSKYFDIRNHYTQMKNNDDSMNHCFYIKELVNSVKFWDESLLSLLYTKIANGDFHFGVLVSFFTKTLSVINQIGKIISTSSRLLKLFFATTLTMNNDFISEIMKYVFFHGDLIAFRIELVLHSLLATQSLKKIDDTIYELLKIGFSNRYYDLTCSVISSLFKINYKKSSKENGDKSDNECSEDEAENNDDLVNNCKITNLNLYGSGYFNTKTIPIIVSDPEEVLVIMCENYDKCNSVVFINALKSILKTCYETGKFKLSSEKVMKIVSHSLVEASVSFSNNNPNNDDSIESIFLSIPIKHKINKEYFTSLRNIFLKELRMKHTNEIGYFRCLKRVSQILSFDEMKPLLCRLFLNICVDPQNKEIQNVIYETLQILFKTETDNDLSSVTDDDLTHFLDNIDEHFAQKIIQDMFDTINFQDELEKESLFFCFRRLSNLYPKALMTARPPVIPQIITTYSYIDSPPSLSSKLSDMADAEYYSNSDSELDSDISEPKETTRNSEYSKLGLKFGDIFQMLAESDLVLFFNQLTLSPKCSFFDRIILDLCQCEDKDFQLFACIENEFSELIDQTINFKFIFQILSNYIQYQPNIRNNDFIELHPKVIASLLFIMFLCISESFIQNNSDIIDMLKEPINHLEVLISLPLMPFNSFNSFDKTIEIIPLPIFSNKVILAFLAKCVKLHSSKHHEHLEKLIDTMISSFSQNDQVFQNLISIYSNPKLCFSHSHYQPKIERILSSQKKIQSLVDSSENVDKNHIIKNIFDIAFEMKSFNVALNCVIAINETKFYEEFLININNFCTIPDNDDKKEIRIEITPKFLLCIQKAINCGILKNEIIVSNILDFVQKDVFSQNRLSLNIFDICLLPNDSNSNTENIFKKLFFYFVGKGSFYKYVQFSIDSLKEFKQLKEIKPYELEIIFYIMINLIGIKEDQIDSILSEFFSHLLEYPLNKEALALSRSIVKQYEENQFTLTFPTISITPKDDMYHI